MLGGLIIVFREVIEAGLIVGIVMAVTKGVRGSRWLIGLGVAAGVAGACLVAAFAGALAGALAGVGQEVFNAGILLLAVAMLTWHNVWMASHGRELAAEVSKVGAEVRAGTRGTAALGVVVAVAVMREGSRWRCFSTGSPPRRDQRSRLAGRRGARPGARRSGDGAHLSRLVTIPTRWLFRVTTVLIGFLAAVSLRKRWCSCSRRASSPRSRHRLGHLRDSLRYEPDGPRAAYADRLRRPALAVAGAGLCGGSVRRLRAVARLRPSPARGPCRRGEIVSSSETQGDRVNRGRRALEPPSKNLITIKYLKITLCNCINGSQGWAK